MGKKFIEVLKCLFIEGGIEIITPGVARTFIQPDADIIIHIEKTCIGQQNIFDKFQHHINDVHTYINSINRILSLFEWIFNRIFKFISVILLLWTGYKLINEVILVKLLIPFIIGLFFLFAKSLIVFFVKYFIIRLTEK